MLHKSIVLYCRLWYNLHKIESLILRKGSVIHVGTASISNYHLRTI